ncbi:MAG: lysylphosphatidylglycerol synthase transmembrane domain-containing protein [Chroococcales cyanobacterium]
MKKLLSQLKPYLRWTIVIAIIVFLGKSFKENWQEVTHIHITSIGWLYLSLSVFFTLIAYTWAGWVWSWILRELNHSVSSPWLIRVYLKTNLAKYLPGNVWHYYGRISSVTSADVPTATATFSVLVEPLLIAAAAISFIVIGTQFNSVAVTPTVTENSLIGSWQLYGLMGVLLLLHPQFLNRVLQVMGKFQVAQDSQPLDTVSLQVRRYPMIPLFGGIVYLALRTAGFLCVVLALTPITPEQFPLLLTAFSLAWLSSSLIPGAPGGIGVFEATVLAILSNPFSMGVVLSVTALYRLINTLAEAIGAGLASLVEGSFRLVASEAELS